MNKYKIGLSFLIFMLLMVIVPMGFQEQANQTSLTQVLQAPSREAWFGTDEFGRNLFLRVWSAGRLSVGISLVTMLLSYMSGLLLGGLAAFVGGKIDQLVMLVLDLFLAFPSLLVAITIAGILGGGLQNGLLALWIAYTPYYAKLTRTEVKKLLHKDYVQVMYMNGAPMWYRMVRILRSVQAPLLTYASLNIGSIILSLATLSFLGIGVKIPQAEWGTMLNAGKNVFEQAPWMMIFPGLAITGTVFYFNWLGRKIKDYLEGNG